MVATPATDGGQLVPTDESVCPACGASLVPGGAYCEACGHRLAGPAAGGTVDGATLASTATPPAACGKCASTTFDEGGYCGSCGARRPAGADHAELDLGTVAGVSDIGSRHQHNEDAMAVGAGDGFTIAVVCDGVSSSNRPDTASHAAADAAVRALAEQLIALGTPAVELDAAPDPDSWADADARTRQLHPGPSMRALAAAISVAGDAAQAAAAAAGAPSSRDSLPNPPCSTFVTAVVTARGVSVGWVGDSRAYWVPDAGTPDPPACLTIDDTLSGQLAAAGVPVSPDMPNAGALMRWLGADAVDTRPHTATLLPTGPGRVVVCSDGLYRYLADPAEMAAALPSGSPYEVAAAMVSYALQCGGHDNVSVVVMPYPPFTPDATR